MNAVAQDLSNDPVLDALWQRVLDAWDDDKTHAVLLDHALRSEALPEIAGLYRALVDDPDKGRVAKKKIDGIMIAATQMLMSMKTPRPAKVPLPIALSAVAVCLLMFGWLALAIWGKH